jgi:hypothetical protein
MKTLYIDPIGTTPCKPEKKARGGGHLPPQAFRPDDARLVTERQGR